MKTEYVIDANVVIRLLLNDHQEHAKKAKAIFQSTANGQCSLLLTQTACAEIVWVLASHYGIARQDIARQLALLLDLPGVVSEKREVLLDALQRYATMKVDYIDCYHAAVAAAKGGTVLSFDKDFRKFNDIAWEQS